MKKKILLINPGVDSAINNRQKRINQKRLHFPGLGLPYLAALTPPDYEVEIIDEENEKITEYRKADLVGITGKTIQAPRMYEIAEEYRKLGVPVILGGVHVTFMNDEAMQHSDSVVTGEAEELWQEILTDFSNGKLKKKYDGPGVKSLDYLPIPRLDLLDGPAFRFPRGSLNAIMTTRGCPFNCTFCSVRQMFGQNIRKRSVENVVAEINRMRKSDFFLFYDDNIFNFRDYSMSLFRRLQYERIFWGGHASLDIAEDPELLKAAYKAGCRSLIIGVESLNPENNNYISKKADKDLFGRQIRIIRDMGIENLTLAFIVGFDNDSPATFEDIYNFVSKNNIQSVQVSVLTPLPGTSLFYDLKKENRIINYDWINYDLNHVVYNPKKMKPEELQEKYDELEKSLYRLSYRKIITELNT